MTDLFCEEPIIAAYQGIREYGDIDGADSFFDCYHDLAFHTTKGHRIVLETKHYRISLEYDGVIKSEKKGSIKKFERDGEWLYPYIEMIEGDLPWVNYESTLFVGERLLGVEQRDGYYLLIFDDFELKLVPHALCEDDFPTLRRKEYHSYCHVHGAERLLQGKCSCGGEGELFLDFVDDYIVRCRSCKRSTYAQMNAQDAIDEWNGGFLPCDSSNITIE